MKFYAVLVLLPLLLAAPGQATPPADSFAALPPNEQEAQAPTVLDTTSKVGLDVFALGGIGIANALPDKFVAYQAVLRRSDAADVFQKLLRSSNPVTQMYALTGLAKCAPNVFRSVAPRFAGRNDTVQTGQGCILGQRRFGEMVSNLQKSGSPYSAIQQKTVKTN